MHYLRNVEIKIKPKIFTNMRTHRNSNTEIPEQFQFGGGEGIGTIFTLLKRLYIYKEKSRAGASERIIH